jgi:hypothetical protein
LGEKRITVNVLIENEKDRFGIEGFWIKDSLEDIVKVPEQGFVYADQNSAEQKFLPC